MMHSIFRRDRRRHLDKVVDFLLRFSSANDFNSKETSFDKLRERFLRELLSLQMISKYHEQDSCKIEDAIQEKLCRDYINMKQI